MEKIKARLEDVNLKNHLYLEREHAVFDRQLSDIHSDAASLKLRIQDIESKNTKVRTLTKRWPVCSRFCLPTILNLCPARHLEAV